MFKFTKSFIKNEKTKIASNYVKPDDLRKIEEIRERMYPKKNNDILNNQVIEPNKTDKIIYKDRIDALNNIKKD